MGRLLRNCNIKIFLSIVMAVLSLILFLLFFWTSIFISHYMAFLFFLEFIIFLSYKLEGEHVNKVEKYLEIEI